jgi:hypothetical protein
VLLNKRIVERTEYGRRAKEQRFLLPTPSRPTVHALRHFSTSLLSALCILLSAPPLYAVPGVWENVTPSNVDLSGSGNGFPGCGNYGTITVGADPARPSELYVEFNCQGIWKSTNFGQTWSGPINTGAGAANAIGAGGIAVARGPSGQPPILYYGGIRGTGIGFSRSTDGGVSWTKFNITHAAGSRQDFYPPVVDPYDSNHVVMAGHEFNGLVQSFDGGQTWSNIPMAGGMNQNGGTAAIFFINTGDAATTRNTLLYMGQHTGGTVGTWRTSNGGTSWAKVDNNEHPHGNGQIYQPDTDGVVYMAGAYGSNGWGISRSANYGQTWTHAGSTSQEATMFGTPNRVYSGFSWACGGCNIDPTFQSAPQPGLTGWQAMPWPSGMTMGPALTATVFDGTRYVILSSNWLAGLWRYEETSTGLPPPSGSACDLNSDSSTNVTDVQLCANQAIGAMTCSAGDINHDSSCNVIDVQRVVNAALGGQCVSN